MTDCEKENGIYFVYDGECPMCTRAALALRIKQAYGELHRVEARQNPEHPVLRGVSDLGLDLDEGMVLYDGAQLYHGKDALCFMARYGDAKNLFNLTMKSLYWSDFLARITYPLMRATRNWLLSRKHVDRIDNLNLKNEPIFKPIFGDAWNDLPPVIHKHYANHPYCEQSTIVEGKLDVMCAGPVQWLAPLFWLTRGIPPQNEKMSASRLNSKAIATAKPFTSIESFILKNANLTVFVQKCCRLTTTR